MIVGVYDRTFDFQSLFGGYIFQEEMVRKRVVDMFVFQKRFDNMIR